MTLTDLSLPPDLEMFVRDQIASGAFATERDVVRAGLAELRRSSETLEEKREYLRSLIRPALEELDRGEGQPLDVEDVIRRGEARLAAKNGTRT